MAYLLLISLCVRRFCDRLCLNVETYILGTIRRSVQNAIFEVFTAVRVQVEVFWVVTPSSVVVGYQRS